MKALIVDDDLALVDVIDFTLRRAGFTTVFAHDGVTALSRWEMCRKSEKRYRLEREAKGAT